MDNCAVLCQLGYYPMTLLTSFMVQPLPSVLFRHTGDFTDPHQRPQVRRLSRWLIARQALVREPHRTPCLDRDTQLRMRKDLSGPHLPYVKRKLCAT